MVILHCASLAIIVVILALAQQKTNATLAVSIETMILTLVLAKLVYINLINFVFLVI